MTGTQRMKSRHMADGAPRFTIDSHKQEDGTYLAKAAGLDFEGKGERQDEAVNDLKRQLHDAVMSGTL